MHIQFLFTFIITGCLSFYTMRPLSFAIKYDYMELASYMVEHGADVNIRNFQFYFIYIDVLLFSPSFHIDHFFITFYFFSSQS